jgi:hypothetical protein
MNEGYGRGRSNRMYIYGANESEVLILRIGYLEQLYQYVCGSVNNKRDLREIYSGNVNCTTLVRGRVEWWNYLSAK